MPRSNRFGMCQRRSCVRLTIPQRTPALVQWAAEFGLKTGATVKLLHVLPPISAWLTLPTVRDIQKQMKEEARVKIDLLRRSAGVDLPVASCRR